MSQAIINTFQEQGRQLNEIAAEIVEIQRKKGKYEEILVVISAKSNTNTKKAGLLRITREKIENLRQEYLTKLGQITALKAEMARSLPQVRLATAEIKAARNSSSRRNRKSRRTRRRGARRGRN